MKASVFFKSSKVNEQLASFGVVAAFIGVVGFVGFVGVVCVCACAPIW